MANIILNIEECNSITPVIYGALYNGKVVDDIRNIGNGNFRLPTYSEINDLAIFLGGNDGGAAKLKDTGTLYWNEPNSNATNEYGFNARGSGYREVLGFHYRKIGVSYWTSEINAPNNHNVMSIEASDEYLRTDSTSAPDNFGLSIRLVNDSTSLNEGEIGTYTQNDGRIISTIVINGLEWTMNIIETKYNNGDWVTGYIGGVYTPISNSEWANLETEGMCFYEDANEIIS